MTFRVAWVSPYLPQPATSGGPIRQQRLAKSLAEVAELHLFARADFWERRRASSPELDIFASRWVGCDYAPSWGASALNGIRLDETSSTRVRRGSPIALWSALQSAHRRAPFDAVVVSHSWAALGASRAGLPWVLDEHNVESEFFRELYVSRGKAGPTIAKEIAAMQDWERHAWRHASLLTCVSARDAALMTPIRLDLANGTAAASPVVVENGVDTRAIEVVPAARHASGVLFVGALHHAPNVAAASRLINEIMPRVWARTPDVLLTIVGGPVPGGLLQEKRRAKGPVELAGRVQDTVPYLQKNAVFANPLVRGAGSSLKTLEALAAGIPLVSSACGARGFELVPGVHYARAETDEEFAEGILKAIMGGDSVVSMAKAGRERAQTFDWSILGRRFATNVCDMIGRRRREPSPNLQRRSM